MKKLFLYIVAAGFSVSSYAQDFHLSQYDAAALNVNPGMTGVFKGEYRIHGHYRNQWLAVATKPFTTGLISFDMNKGKWGFGGQIANFRAGVGGFNVVSVMPSAAYKISFGEKKHHFISVGAQVGFFQKSINSSSLTFANQYVKTNGGEFNTALSTNENFSGNGIFNLDINAGAMYYYADPKSMINPFGGITVFHINNPQESFLGETNKLPIRPEGILGARVVVTPNISIIPKVFFQYQKEAMELTYAAQGQFYLANYDLFLLGGITYRNKDAAIVEFGAKYAKFIGRISYDINTSSLTNVSRGRGGSEFSLTYIFSTPNPNPVPTCPRL
ncbi:MAG: PorP/SprF family type IX secretion system membrane protein [Crocinitomicaceae bacterium]|nr:PorP/SprF family type IX secretion system membrane protein [Crocinitomicaceae bacterium]